MLRCCHLNEPISVSAGSLTQVGSSIGSTYSPGLHRCGIPAATGRSTAAAYRLGSYTAPGHHRCPLPSHPRAMEGATGAVVPSPATSASLPTLRSVRPADWLEPSPRLWSQDASPSGHTKCQSVTMTQSTPPYHRPYGIHADYRTQGFSLELLAPSNPP